MSELGRMRRGRLRRLSAGEGTKGERLHDWAYLELADLDAGDADLEELVEVARHDAQKAQALEQRHGRIGGLGEHAALELEQGELAIDEVIAAEQGFGCR